MFENKDGKKPAFLTVGTPQCGLACAFLGAVIAVLFLTIGFWKTLFIALFIALGYFVGAFKNKEEIIRNSTEALLPHKEVKVYQSQDKKAAPADSGAEDSGNDGEEDSGDGEDDPEDEDEEDPEDAEEDTEDEDGDEETDEDEDADGYDDEETDPDEDEDKNTGGKDE